MKYIKLYENFENTQVPNEYFLEVQNMLKKNNLSIEHLIKTNTGLSWGPHKITLREDNQVYLVKGVTIKRIGKLKGTYSSDTTITDSDRPNPNEYPDKLTSSEIYEYISDLHSNMYDTDIHDRVYKFKNFVLKKLNISEIDVEAFDYDEETVDDYVKMLNDNGGQYPPIVYDSYYDQLIDGTHRCQALIKAGVDMIWAYVGEDLDNSYIPTYGEDEETEEIKNNSVYPSLKWVKSKLRMNSIRPFKKKVLGAYIVGSEAKGTAGPNSDLDIAVIIESMPRRTSIQVTDHYHSAFVSDQGKPKWNDRIVDFQFFFPSDPELDTYSKIELK